MSFWFTPKRTGTFLLCKETVGVTLRSSWLIFKLTRSSGWRESLGKKSTGLFLLFASDSLSHLPNQVAPSLRLQPPKHEFWSALLALLPGRWVCKKKGILRHNLLVGHEVALVFHTSVRGSLLKRFALFSHAMFCTVQSFWRCKTEYDEKNGH